MSEQKPIVGDLGTPIYVRIVDEDGEAVDASTATSITGVVTKPDSSTAEITFSASADPDHLAADGWAVYQTSATAPSFFDQSGKWRIRVTYAISGVGQWTSASSATFKVYPD